MELLSGRILTVWNTNINIKIKNMKVQNEANMKYVILSTGLVVDMDKVIGVQPNPDNENEFFIHTITSQYYKVSKEDYKYLITCGFGLDVKEIS